MVPPSLPVELYFVFVSVDRSKKRAAMRNAPIRQCGFGRFGLDPRIGKKRQPSILNSPQPFAAYMFLIFQEQSGPRGASYRETPVAIKMAPPCAISLSYRSRRQRQ